MPLDELRNAIERAVKGTANHNVKNMANIPLTRQSEKVLKITYLEAKIFKSQLIGTEHLLLSILRDEDNIATQILNKFEVNYDAVKEMLEMQSDAGASPRAKAEAEDGMMTAPNCLGRQEVGPEVKPNQVLKNPELRFWIISDGI